MEMAQYLEPLLWPMLNIVKAFGLDEVDNSKRIDHGEEGREMPDVMPYLDISGHMMVMSGSIRAWIMAYLVVYWITPGEYPAFVSGITLELDWIAPIFIRNVVGTLTICGFWDFILLYSPIRKKLEPFKMNPKYPSSNQLIHDAIYTTMASCIASAIEVWYCYYIASTGDTHLSLYTWSTLFWMLLNTHLRLPHFYVTHRMMHPWRLKEDSWMGLGRYIPDMGQWLYKHVHSIHHKSHNPSTFSGTSMHPVEAFIYYSACFLPILFKMHPTIVLACIIDCGVGAFLGHDGFQLPYGMGDDFHQLHHAHSDCNYGTAIDAIDLFMGTSIKNKHDLN
jgi:Delta7-sterol 5-desaturase